ncbi:MULTISPECIES: hypothetical protein [Pseudoalteromonas]|jgi:starvation-inducible outer membrane lipoprotein|uniref:Orphan protein n=1 Tax=Pseudoalteromonas aliena SW19 TaxID=1314866 RepID=A0ABR9E065_9GAMM|nr:MULTISPECIES: hypothetical protein [Pseudoalteromonas]MBE0359952.1 hypothetical protein [Pseudoalteromonas aliena SW19]
MRNTLLFIVLIALSACTSTPSEMETTQVDSKNDASNLKKHNSQNYVCDKEIITGTKFQKKRCRTTEQIVADKAQAREMLNSQKSSAGVQN